MADADSIALTRPANPPLIVTLTLGRNARLVVEPDVDSGLVLVHVEGDRHSGEGDRHSGASLQPESALELAMRLIGCVARSFKPRP
jgi:hypothetical protein